MDIMNRLSILFVTILCLFELTPTWVGGTKDSNLRIEQRSSSHGAGEQNEVLRNRSNGSSVEEADINRDTIPVLPKPFMFRWFPKHDRPPTDRPVVTSKQQHQLQSVLKPANKSRAIEAIFQDQFSVEIEDMFEAVNGTEQPLESSRKPSRERRDIRSLNEVRRRNREIMRRRQEIERQRGVRTTSAPRYRSTRQPIRKSVPTRKPQWRKLTRRPNLRPRTTRRTPPSRTPWRRPQSNNARSKTTARPTKASSTQNKRRTTTVQNMMPSGNTTVIIPTKSTSQRASTQRPQASHKNYRNKNQPHQVQRRKPLKAAKPRVTTKPTISNPRNGNVKKNSKTKSSGMRTILVVKPVLSSRGTKTTRSTTRLVVRRDNVAQNRNSKPRVTFSKWGTWGACSAKLCGRTGRQLRTRSCFGDRLTPADYAVCTYDSLVSYQKCESPTCATVEQPQATPATNYAKRKTRWSAWSKCSVTCGTGGQQTRTKLCYDTAAPDDSEEIDPVKCENETVESRPCQYSVSCPMWDEWSEWSSCSKTCGPDGVSFRDRKCIVKRFMTFKSQGGNGQRRRFDNAAGSRPVLREPATTNKKNAIKQQHRSSRSSKQSLFYSQGSVFLRKDGQQIFIVDAPRPKQDTQLPSQSLSQEFHEDKAAKELVDFGLCFELGGFSEEEKRCLQSRCPAEWGKWAEWSPCSATCGSGISRRERTCSGDVFSELCVGRKYAYRRCYSPPCWSEWTRWSRCSTTCGSEQGTSQRTRQCLGVTTVLPEYLTCGEEALETRECFTKEQCPGEVWGSWGPYGDCSATCNGGYRRRERTCLATACTGPSEDFGRCNIHECPGWSDWSKYSCCSVTCGEGTRTRTRQCLHGKVGSNGCTGKVAEAAACYRAPCNGRKKSVFSTIRCGIGSVSKLKRIARLRIYGGAHASAHAWPWQSSWQHKDPGEAAWQHFCGATLLHPRWVITASHCTEESEYIVNHRNPGQDWSVVVGMTKLYKDGDRYFVERIFIHPEYEYKSVTKNDIALLKLQKMVPVTNDVMPACLPKGVRPEPGDRCFVTGWGYTSSDPNASLSLSLQEASVPIMRFPRCRTLGDYYRYFLDSSIHMCAGNPITASADSCTGDSGGPLVCARNKHWYLGAVTSFGFADCGTPGHVGIYAPMETYEQWVRNTVESNTYERC